MPYKRLKQLPKKQTDQYGKKGKRTFKAAFNSAWEQYGDEGTAFAVAHAAAKKAKGRK